MTDSRKTVLILLSVIGISDCCLVPLHGMCLYSVCVEKSVFIYGIWCDCREIHVNNIDKLDLYPGT